MDVFWLWDNWNGAGWWSFGIDFARKAEIFGVHNSSSSHAYNRKSTFLVPGEGPTYDINGSFGSSEKNYN